MMIRRIPRRHFAATHAGDFSRFSAWRLSAGVAEPLSANDALARLWAKDASLWPAELYQTESLKSNLRWLDLPGQLGPLLARVAARAAKIEPQVLKTRSLSPWETPTWRPKAFCACLPQSAEQEPSCSTTSIPILSAPSMKCCTSTGPSLSLPTNQANISRRTPCSCIFSKDLECWGSILRRVILSP